MDVEGAEILALNGALDVLQSERPPKLLIEYHGDELRKQGGSLLSRLGYHSFTPEGGRADSGTMSRHILSIPVSRMTEKQKT
jgi:hypothetical protein